MGGVGKRNEKCSKTPKICTNLKELEVILRNLNNFHHKIVVWRGGKMEQKMIKNTQYMHKFIGIGSDSEKS